MQCINYLEFIVDNLTKICKYDSLYRTKKVMLNNDSHRAR